MLGEVKTNVSPRCSRDRLYFLEEYKTNIDYSIDCSICFGIVLRYPGYCPQDIVTTFVKYVQQILVAQDMGVVQFIARGDVGTATILLKVYKTNIDRVIF